MRDREEFNNDPIVEENEPSSAKSKRPKKQRFTIWRMMLLVGMVAFFLGIVRPVFLAFDALGHGPFTVAFNRKCQRLADEAHLIGRPEEDVIVILGTPSSIWEYAQPDGCRKTYNYDPSFMPCGKFQVHCRGGVVVSLEQMDD